MCWPIFPDTNGVVGEDENAGHLHDRSHADWRPPVQRLCLACLALGSLCLGDVHLGHVKPAIFGMSSL